MYHDAVRWNSLATSENLQTRKHVQSVFLLCMRAPRRLRNISKCLTPELVLPSAALFMDITRKRLPERNSSLQLWIGDLVLVWNRSSCCQIEIVNKLLRNPPNWYGQCAIRSQAFVCKFGRPSTNIASGIERNVAQMLMKNERLGRLMIQVGTQMEMRLEIQRQYH